MKRLIACALLASLPAASIAETLKDVIAEYEALARQTDTNEGSDWPDVRLAATKQRQEKYAELRDRHALHAAALYR